MSLTLRAKAIVPPPVWSVLKAGKRAAVRTVQKSLGAAGLNLSRRSDFYSPLPVLDELRQTEDLWKKPSSLAGLRYDLDAMEGRLRDLARWFPEFSRLPSYDEAKRAGFGPGYPLVDALILFSILREQKPARYTEVGSGLSTYYCTLAGEANTRENRPLGIRCIEPYPYPRLRSVPDIELRVAKVQEVPVAEFQQLREGDLLFIDSSHALKVGSDVTYLLLEILPALNPGVWIHIHDIPFPFNIPYPPEFWIYEQNWPIYWNEAMAVQAFLAFNHAFEIHLSLPLLRYHREHVLEQLIPHYPKGVLNENTFSSLWLRKVA